MRSNLSEFLPGMKNRILVLELTKRELRAAFFKKPGLVETCTTIGLRELPDEDLVLHLKTFIENRKFGRTCLVLPKAQMIERHLEVPISEEEEWKQVIMKQVENALPVSPSEVSHAMEIQKQAGLLKVHLLAYPLQSLEKFLALLGQAGISIDEIVSSEQALFWCFLWKSSCPSSLVLSFDEETTEMIFCESRQLRFSRIFHAHGENPVSEIEFALFEGLKKPESIFILGKIDTELELALRKTFPVPVERYIPEEGFPSLYGASWVNSHQPLSLLPPQHKIRNRKLEVVRMTKELAAVCCFIPLTIFGGWMLHHKLCTAYLEKMESEIKPLRSAQNKLARAINVLEFFRDKNQSHWVFLDFLRQLSAEIPRQVTLNEIGFDGSGFKVKGNSRSYSGIAETVQLLNKTGFFETCHLGYARLRKKESKEFFEFVVECESKPGPRKDDLPRDVSMRKKSGSFASRIRMKKGERYRLRNFEKVKPLYLAAYEKVFQVYPRFKNQEDFLSDYVRELGSRFESHQLRVLKIEPQGIVTMGVGKEALKEMKAAVQLEGDMKGLLAFLYEMASAGFNEIHFLDIRLSPDHQDSLSYEMVLGRWMP